MKFLLLNKDGVVMEVSQGVEFDKTDVYQYSAAGDTVLIAVAHPWSHRIVFLFIRPRACDII